MAAPEPPAVPPRGRRYTPEQAAQVSAVIGAALAGRRKSRRHPADVAAARLGAALERWHDQFPPEERDMIGRIIARLDEIAEKAL
jgi:hypothetical protein